MTKRTHDPGTGKSTDTIISMAEDGGCNGVENGNSTFARQAADHTKVVKI